MALYEEDRKSMCISHERPYTHGEKIRISCTMGRARPTHARDDYSSSFPLLSFSEQYARNTAGSGCAYSGPDMVSTFSLMTTHSHKTLSAILFLGPRYAQPRYERRILTNAIRLASQDPPNTKGANASVPPPLNIPPSRARRQLAARLAQRKKEAEAAETDPDAVDHAALETAHQLPEEPSDLDLGPATEKELREAGLQITGLRPGDASKFSGMFDSDEDSSDSDLDEDEAGRDETLGREGGDYDDPDTAGVGRRRSQKQRHRRPSTTEAKERKPLDDDDDDDDEGDISAAFGKKMVLNESEGPFADPEEMEDEDSEDELVEIKPRRSS